MLSNAAWTSVSLNSIRVRKVGFSCLNTNVH